MGNTLDELTERMHRIQDRKEAELRKLCENPTLYDVAVQLTDALLKDLDYLCNYTTIIDAHDNKHDLGEVVVRLESHILDTFKKLTGTRYPFEVNRQVDFVSKAGEGKS